MTYLILIAGFVVLIKGADLLVDGASFLARRFNISDMVIGLTVVAFGTSLPELFVNLSSSLNGNSQIAIGNVLGSNIANILLILGLCSTITPLTVTRGTIWREIPFSLLAAIALGVCANDVMIDHGTRSVLTRSDGVTLILFFAVFLYYLAYIAKNSTPIEIPSVGKTRTVSVAVIFIVIGLAGLVLGGEWITRGAVELAKRLHLSESVIGLSIVAIGTSLPELATSTMAAYRKNLEIAVGNVVGSNIFNIFFVLATSAMINPLEFSTENNLDMAVVIISSLLLFMCMFTGKKRLLDRWEGVLFLIFYAGYMVFRIYGMPQ